MHSLSYTLAFSPTLLAKGPPFLAKHGWSANQNEAIFTCWNNAYIINVEKGGLGVGVPILEAMNPICNPSNQSSGLSSS